MRKILIVFLMNLVCFGVYADDCSRNEKRFISIGDKRVSAPKYDKNEHVMISDKNEWEIATRYPKKIIAQGVSQCLNTENASELSSADSGYFCWCKVLFMDGYDVDAKWAKVKKYTEHKYKPYKDDDEQTIEKEQRAAEQKNIKECLSGCSEKCLENINTLAGKIKSFGVCDKPLYKDSDIRCVINGDFVRIKNIAVFDDVAQLEIDKNRDWVLLKPQDSKPDEKNFIGMYNDSELHLKIVSDGGKVRYKTKSSAYSFQICDKL